MPPVIVGTAGHVDHGKTSLTKLLTGCDTDRLKEEKERGMSIDLGFAPCRLPGNRVVGIVDVPGHIDFIRNMVAGAASIDILILVIAADDGVMPQTIEHLQIIRLLRAPRLMVALTKTDLVDAETLDFAKEEIALFLHEYGYDAATVPILPVSCVTFEGIDAVRKELDRIVGSIGCSDETRAFRMNIERVFQVKGFGTVVSGIPVSGSIRAGHEVEILPVSRKTVIRSVQNYKHETDRAEAGVCSALNLKHADHSSLSRGMTIAEPGVFPPVSRFIASVLNIGKTAEIGSGVSLKLHSGTSETLARLTPIDPLRIAPGSTGFCRIRLAHPIVLSAGDGFILRKLSPSSTIGGGTVLSVSDIVEKKSSPHLIERIRSAAEAMRRGDGFAAELFAGSSMILGNNELETLTRLAKPNAPHAIDEKIASGLLVRLGASACLVVPHLHKVVASVEKTMKRYHAENPQSYGIDLESVAQLTHLEPADPGALATFLVSIEQSPFQITAGKFSLKSFSPRVDHPLKGKILAAIRQAGRNCLASGNVQTETGIGEKELKAFIRILVQEKAIIVIGNHYIAAEAFESCRNILLDLAEKQEMVVVSEFRDAAGIGRNIAVAILEKFDAIGFTRRYPDGRKLTLKRGTQTSA
jgi:selenocysteine-specific elongation factor